MTHSRIPGSPSRARAHVSLALCAVLAVAVAGCSDTVSGQHSGPSSSAASSSPPPGVPTAGGGAGAAPGTRSGGSGGGSTPPTGAGGTGTAPGSSTGDSPTTGATAGTGAATALACVPPEITVTGAPFCFTQPAGFYDYSNRSDYAPGWTYRTLIAEGQHEEIEVLAQPVQTDVDGLTTAGAFSFANQYRQQTGQSGIASATTLTPGTVAQARAYRQDVVFTSGVSAVNRFILRGHSLVYVSCQYLEHKALVLDACTSVLASLHLRDS